MTQKDYSPWVEDDSQQYITATHPPVPRKVVCAANIHEETGLMLVGSRHWSSAMHKQLDAIKDETLRCSHFEQGFIDQYDQYLSREDAKRIALKNGQELIREDWGCKLFSENLY